MTRYYPCPKTGRLKRSRYLWYYSVVHNILAIGGMPLVLERMQSDEKLMNTKLNSNWISLSLFLYFGLHCALILSCTYSSQFLHTSIYRIIDEVMREDRAELPILYKRYMTIMICVKFSIGFCFWIMNIIRLTLNRSEVGWLENLGKMYGLFTISMSIATYLLIYSILWKICRIAIGLQEQLKLLLAGNAKLTDLHRLYRQLQCLIRVCNEFCVTFRHILLWYPIRLLCIGMICGYLQISIKFGHPNPALNSSLSLILLFIMSHAFIEFFNLNNLGEDVANFIPTILTIFQQSQPQAESVERAVSSHCFELILFILFLYSIDYLDDFAVKLSEHYD